MIVLVTLVLRSLLFTHAAQNATNPGQNWVSNAQFLENYSSYLHHLGLDICFDENNFHNSLPAHLIHVEETS